MTGLRGAVILTFLATFGLTFWGVRGPMGNRRPWGVTTATTARPITVSLGGAFERGTKAFAFVGVLRLLATVTNLVLPEELVGLHVLERLGQTDKEYRDREFACTTSQPVSREKEASG